MLRFIIKINLGNLSSKLVRLNFKLFAIRYINSPPQFPFLRWPVDGISDVPHFFRKKYEPLSFPTVVSSGTVFSTVITSGNVLPTVISNGNVFPTVTISGGNVFPTVIISGNVFPTIIISGNVLPTVISDRNTLCMHLHKQHVLRQQGGPARKPDVF